MSTPLCDRCAHKEVCSLKKDYLDILGSCELEVSNRGQNFTLALGCNHHLREQPEFLFIGGGGACDFSGNDTQTTSSNCPTGSIERSDI